MTRWGLALLLLVAACQRPPEEAHEPAAHQPVVPGIETAVSATAPVRDVVGAFGTVIPDGEPPEVRDARTALAEAEARRRLAAQQVRRLESLAGGIAPARELDAARAEEAAAAAAASRARSVLAAYGSGETRPPLGPDERWVVARVMQVDVPRIDAGGEAAFVADAFPGERFPGSVEGDALYVDPATQRAPVRLRVTDAGGRLRPGMTGGVELEVGTARDGVVVPTGAVVYDDAQPLVFVARDGGYERLPVVLGIVRDGRAEIVSGLAAGTPVVVTGAASLLSAARLPAGGE